MRSEIFNSIEAWIRHGQLQKAARIVRQLSIEEDLSRPDQLRLARLARRALIPLVGVQLLRPWIRPSARSSARATPEEKIEFAACLINYGAWAEGVDVLRRLEPRDHPEVLLFQSFALFSQWDYESALPLLRQYVAHPEVTGYTRLVGLANLAAALVHERIEGEAEALLGELEDQTRSQGHDLLLGHILEFRAELDIHLGNLDAADRHLASALEHARSRNVTRDLLFLRKWSAVADLSRSPENEAARRGLMRVREAAVSADQYETVRDCDYHFARIVRQGEAGLRLYWGSPFEAYRNRFLRDCSWIRERLSERFTLEIPAAIQAEAESLFELDLGSGYSPQRSYVLEPGQKMLGLLGLLVNDSYKPKRVVDLFCGIYPGEHFHPETSHDRVHQLIRRLRKELRSNRTGITVIENRGIYRVSSERHRIRLILPGAKAAAAPKRQLREFLERLGAIRSPFQASDAAAWTGLPFRTVQYHLNKGVASGLLARHGSGKATYYQVTEHSG